MAAAGGSWKGGAFMPAANSEAAVRQVTDYLSSLDQRFGAGSGRTALASQIRASRRSIRDYQYYANEAGRFTSGGDVARQALRYQADERQRLTGLREAARRVRRTG